MRTLVASSWIPKPTHHVVCCTDLGTAIDSYCSQFGFRLDTIGPADAPAAAVLSGHGMTLLLHTPDAEPAPAEMPVNQPASVHTPAQASGGEGRAGMLYRDLLPDRQGGTFIASHITIPTGGPVADYVHYHDVRFQLIFCHAGWVDVVYEDQGPPFRLEPGDLVIQPPTIRHRVLESSAGLEVIEIGYPAVHDTQREHQIMLPTKVADTERAFGGQRFVRHTYAAAPWEDHETGQVQRSAVAPATDGLADARLRRITTPTTLKHSGEFFFWFVRSGSATTSGSLQIPLLPGDTLTVAAGDEIEITPETECEVLEVSLRAAPPV